MGAASIARFARKQDLALQNIPANLHALFRKLGDQFKGSPHRRAEQFLEYVEEHRGELAGVWRERDMDREFEGEMARHYAAA